MKQKRKTVKYRGHMYYLRSYFASFYENKTEDDVRHIRLDTIRRNEHEYVGGYPPASWELKDITKFPVYEIPQKPNPDPDTEDDADIESETFPVLADIIPETGVSSASASSSPGDDKPENTNVYRRLLHAKAFKEEQLAEAAAKKNEREGGKTIDFYLDHAKRLVSAALLHVRDKLFEKLPDEYHDAISASIEEGCIMICGGGEDETD